MRLFGTLVFDRSQSLAHCALRAEHLGCEVLTAIGTAESQVIRVAMDQAAANRTALAAYDEGFELQPAGPPPDESGARSDAF